jgi:methionine synthase I (cobalamin-dependent)
MDRRMPRDYLDAIRSRVVVFDGGMGATLEQFDLTQEDYGGLAGKCHEALVLNRPDVIEGVHASMVEAGAEVLETDTFQGSRLKLEEWGLADHTLEINRKAAEIARRAAGEHRFVAGSIGPTGHLPASDDPTLGRITFRELLAVFTEQAQGLIEGGADLLIIETAQDMLEVKAAIFGAREAFKLTGRSVPIQASTARPGRRTCATRSGSSASTRPCPCTASPTRASRCRAPTGRRSSPRSPSRWRACWASSSSATASTSSGAAAAPRPITSARSWSTAPATPSRRARRPGRRMCRA